MNALSLVGTAISFYYRDGINQPYLTFLLPTTLTT